MTLRQALCDDALAGIRRGDGGDEVARAFSLGAEALVRQAASSLAPGTAILAQGGLARRELTPFADVDILVLLAAPPASPADEAAAVQPLYALWDAGFRVGHAVRTVGSLEELFASVKDKDGHAATALLEARYIAGDEELARAALKYARRDLFPPTREALLQEKRRELDARREKYGTSPFLQEPDIKSGAGGLRDLHGLLWIGLLQVGEAARSASGDLLAGLLSAGFLHPREAEALVRGRREILRVRAALHLAIGRCDDRLHAAQAQKVVALLASPTSEAREGESEAEALVRRTVRAMGVIKRSVDDALARLTTTRRGPRRELGGGFVEVDGALHLFAPVARGEAMAQRAPGEVHYETTAALTVGSLIDAERLCAERGLLPSESLAARRSAFVSEANARAGDATASDAPAALLRLCSTTTTTQGTGGAPFTWLLEQGVLALALVDMKRLAQRVRHDGVHALTTDAHLARCADLALSLTSGAEAPPASLAPSLARTTRPHLLVLGALFHDMGKGLPEDHSSVGARIVEREAASMRLAGEEQELLSWLVQEHLLLSLTSQRRDLSDPQVIEEIAVAVRTPERLDLLALLTWVDMCAVAPGVGTEWKARLLATAVQKTRALLLDDTGAVSRGVDHDVRARALAALVISDDGGADDDALAHSFVDGASVRFLAARSDEELRLDCAVFRRQATDGRAASDVRTALGRVHEVRVAATDRPGFLADVAAALASEGANVLDAALDVRSDGVAFDCFVIDDGRGGRLDDSVAHALPAAVAIAAARASRSTRLGAAGVMPPRRRAAPSSVTPRVRVLPSDSWGRTVVEIRAGDRLGLLAELASVFAAQGFTIALARIHTEGPRVTDVFTIDRVDRTAPTAAQLEALQRAVLAVV